MKAIFLLLIASIAYGWTPSPDFVAYMKNCEGFRSTPYCLNGIWHIGYGHRLTRIGELAPLTEVGATELLVQDLKAAYSRIERQTGFVPRGTSAEMLVDFEFNLGTLSHFPKLVDAIERDDLDGIRREYKRYAAGRELKRRNQLFAERYLRN